MAGLVLDTRRCWISAIYSREAKPYTRNLISIDVAAAHYHSNPCKGINHCTYRLPEKVSSSLSIVD